MRRGTSKDANPGEICLQTVWRLLTEDEQREFWYYAGQQARKLNHRTDVFKQLCAALKDAESGRSGVRSTNTLVGAVRPLSSDELRLRVGRLKSQLLDQPNAQPFLINAFCNWIQDSHRAALNAVLDALNCPHDERGSLKGEVPPFSPEVAFHVIGALVSVHSAHTLALVCGGLMVNGKLWSDLRPIFEALQDIAAPSARDAPAAQPPSIELPQSEDTATFKAVNCQPVTIETLKTIREGLDLLGQHLTAASKDTSAYRVPDLGAAIECWGSVRRQHSEVEQALGVSSPSIEDLEAAFSHQSEVTQAVTDVTRCRSIVHVADPHFAGCAVIREKCEVLERIAESRQPLDPASLRAVAALLELVEYGDELDDEHATRLQTEIQSLFGRPVATAALRGKLVFETLSSGPRAGDSESTSSMAAGYAYDDERRSGTHSSSTPASPCAELHLPARKVEPGTEGVVFAETNRADRTPEARPAELGFVRSQLTEDVPSDESHKQVDSPGVVCDDDRHEVIGSRSAAAENTETTAIVDSQIDLTSEYESFSNFSSGHWVDASGLVRPAPWKSDGYVAALSRRSAEAWESGQAAIAYLFARGIVATAGADPLGIDDLASADMLLSDPASHSAGMDTGRVHRLRSCVANPVACEMPNIGLALMLESLRPTHPCSFTQPDIETLIDRASYNDPALNEVVRFLLQGWSAEMNPLSALRTRLLNAPEESVEDLETSLTSAQEALRTQIATLWSAAGGRIQHTHCRIAWTKFIETEVVRLRDELAPSDPELGVRVQWTPTRIRQRVIALGRSFTRIMDSEHVKHRDRSAAETAAQQIVETVEVVADALQRLDARRQRSRSSYDGIPHEAGKRLLSGSSPNTGERLCASLFAAVLLNKPQPNDLRLKVGYLINHVDVIRYLGSETLARPGVARDGVCILDLEEATPVSALMLDWHTKEPPTVDNDSDLWVALRNAAADRERRDVLAALSSTEVLQPHERTLLHRYALELGDSAFEASRELERLWGDCNELMAPTEARLKVVVDEAKSLMAAASTSMTSNILLVAWLKKCIDLATLHRDYAAKALLDLAHERSNNVAPRIANYFKVGDYRAGVSLFHCGTVPKVNGDRLGSRRTLWREDALKIWLEPQTKLANDLKGSTPEQQRLVDLWTAGAVEPNQRDAMPRLLYSVISGEAGRSSSENQKRFPVKLSDLREHKERKTTISCEAIRNYFHRAKLNPTFLPQLADFSQIVITTSPQQTGKGASVLDDWCKAAGNEASGSLIVFIAPGLSLTRRDELCSGLRKRGVTAAILDDVDLCRLCAATSRLDGHDFVPFLEVVFEQLDLDRASPFSSLDGQHVRLETYIGRKHEAERVALGWSYTRVFSGRKLGKSALLKYVANTFDGYTLPSGNTLNVIFITIAGGESERWVVDCIVDEMASRFGLPEKPGLKDQPPAERFSDYMKRFLQEKPQHSVLLILDEADAFVEGQLARYDLDREGSLSFRMMKELPAQVDGNQLPRIRTIFSGYRVTNTRGGVWANAGDVLILRPLAEEEAVQFLEGMLARIGVALGHHAPFVAMRCGFQPAVLIRFGESLIRRLKRSNRSADRETLTVSHDEVLATLGEQGVLDEIKTVVNNNFQGNRIGAVVFGAALLALKDLEPGLALTEGPAQVLAKLREIDPNTDWLERVDTSPLSEIERNLQDFIDRELLTVSDAPRFGVREYRLRFPHFLPVLTQQSEVALEVRQQIQAIRGGASQRRVSQCVLSESALDTIRYWYRQENSRDCKLIVIGGHWTDALLDSKCGVPDRLGCERSALALPTSSEDAVGQISAKMQVFGNVTSNLLKSFLDADADRPLVLIGGLDLQRAARRYALDGGQVPVEVVTLGRLTESTLAWWFEDARALHFKAGNSIAKIARVTGLVPFLVGAFDVLLHQAPGSEVSERELEAALVQFNANMADYALQLSATSWSGALSLREIELVKMAVRITEEVSEEFDLEEEFHMCWSLLEDASTGNAPFSDPGDWSALKLLVEAGLLPARVGANSASNAQSLGRVSFASSGELTRLIKALGPRDVA
jgi:hypothetical protein